MKRTILVLLAVFSLFLGACSGAGNAAATPEAVPTALADKTIVAEGKVEPIQFAEIAFNGGGVVSEVLVEEGQSVKAGDVLVKLGNSESYKAEVARAEEALILAQRAFDASQSGVLKDLGEAYEAVRQAQIRFDNFDIPTKIKNGTPAEGVEKMYAEVEKARAEYEPYKYLSDDNEAKKIRKERLDNAWADLNQAIRWAKLEADLNTAKSRLENAQKEFSAMSADSQGDSLAKAQYESALANLAAAKAALANVELTAPFDGVVAGLNVKVGGSVGAGQIAVTIADFSSWLVKTTDLTELDVVKISEGQAVNITLDAIPDAVFTGKVLSISQTYTDRQGDIIYEVTVTLTETNPATRWGMTAVVKFAQ